ncbi:unnamed protein product [Rotaria sordida]|uniref:Uncharacterized protein n=1 Tax=Rotaria sordida TaxID=392033 RepID=A0A815R8X4_9BILA|nr:unnamed protein product [Rotaria sordida]CAF4090753.1 unnamed protein product [Rotaria sordida]
MRLNRKSLAIISWTNVSKDAVMNRIKREFSLENIQYICVGKGISEKDHQQTLEVQIIFKEKVNKKTRFLDGITQTCCNYQVTKNVLAWNDYIKKDINCLEFGQFESTTSHGCKYSSSLSLSTTAAKAAEAASEAIPEATAQAAKKAIAKAVAVKAIAEATAQAAKKAIAKATAAEAIAKSTAKAAAAAVAEKNAVSISIPFDQNQPLVLKRKTTVEAQAEKRCKYSNEIAEQSLELAQTSMLLNNESIDKIHQYKQRSEYYYILI